MKFVPKGWGYELWLVNNDEYCAKFLYIQPGGKTSFHHHRIKRETMICLSGGCAVGVVDGIFNFSVGNWFTIYPADNHSFLCSKNTDCLILEISASHTDADSYRITYGDSQTIPKEDWRYFNRWSEVSCAADSFAHCLRQISIRPTGASSSVGIHKNTKPDLQEIL